MSLLDFIENLKIPQRISQEHPWCNQDWILFNAYFPITYPINPREGIDAWRNTSIGAVPVGSNYFCRANDSHGPGDIELWYDDSPPFFSEIEEEEIAEFRKTVLQKERYQDANSIGESARFHITQGSSYLPMALIIPHPQSVIIMERALHHKDFRLHW